MTIAANLSKLDERERKLLLALGVVAGFLLLVVAPVAVWSAMSTKRGENEEIKALIASIEDARSSINERNARRDALLSRYQNAAPPLAGFIEQAAKSASLTAADTQDRPETKHGKLYNERHTIIKMHNIGMAPFVSMLQSIESSGHPVAVTRLNIKPRQGEPDKYDVEVGVSAYDRKGDNKAPAPAASASAGADEEDRP